MHLISLPLWFIMVDSCTVLRCLKIDPRCKQRESAALVPTRTMTCSPPSFMTYCVFCIHTFWFCSWSIFLSCFFFFFTQLPFGEGLFHFYPQDTSKRRSKRSARSRQRLQKDRRVSRHTQRCTQRGAHCVFTVRMCLEEHGSSFTLHDNGYFVASVHVEYSAK